MKHVKNSNSVCDAMLGCYCEDCNTIPLADEYQAECCPPNQIKLKVAKLSCDTDSDVTCFLFQPEFPSPTTSSSESPSSVMSSGVDDNTVNLHNEYYDDGDSSISNCGFDFQDVDFSDIVEADERYDDYSLFSSLVNDVESAVDKDGVDSKIPIDRSSNALDGIVYGKNAVIESAYDEENVKHVIAGKANVSNHKNVVNRETHPRPVTYSLRPRAHTKSTSKANSFILPKQSSPVQKHKKNACVQESCDDVKTNKNAQQARINRQRKKAYIQGLESKLADMHKENAIMKSETLHLRRDKRSLENEVLYLKRVLSNDSALANLLRNIDSDGVTLSKSFENQRKRSLALDHDYGRPTSKCRRSESANDNPVKQATGGVCLHVDTGRVSLEFCSKCAGLAGNNSDGED